MYDTKFILQPKDPCWNRNIVSIYKYIFAHCGNTLKNNQWWLDVFQKASYRVK